MHGISCKECILIVLLKYNWHICFVQTLSNSQCLSLQHRNTVVASQWQEKQNKTPKGLFYWWLAFLKDWFIIAKWKGGNCFCVCPLPSSSWLGILESWNQWTPLNSMLKFVNIFPLGRRSVDKQILKWSVNWNDLRANLSVQSLPFFRLTHLFLWKTLTFMAS